MKRWMIVAGLVLAAGAALWAGMNSRLTDAGQTAAGVPLVEIADHAAATPALFAAPEDDPTSEARPEIWSRFAEFTALAEDLETTALDIATSISSEAHLGPAMKSLGETCRACHDTYRE